MLGWSGKIQILPYIPIIYITKKSIVSLIFQLNLFWMRKDSSKCDWNIGLSDSLMTWVLFFYIRLSVCRGHLPGILLKLLACFFGRNWCLCLALVDMIFTSNSQIVAYGDHLLLRRQEMRDDDYDESGQKWAGSWLTSRPTQSMDSAQHRRWLLFDKVKTFRCLIYVGTTTCSTYLIMITEEKMV